MSTSATLDHTISTEHKPTLGVTFRDSKKLPIHRWYPYVEGFASEYIENLLEDSPCEGIVYDPFGGSGTVNVLASQRGRRSAFSEANPLMQFIAQTKVNCVIDSYSTDRNLSVQFDDIIEWSYSEDFNSVKSRLSLVEYNSAFNSRDFFAEDDLRELLAIKFKIENSGYSDLAINFLRLSLASITVSSSHMTRRADLRRRRDGEYVNRVVDVRQAFSKKVGQVSFDLNTQNRLKEKTRLISEDARTLDSSLKSEVSLILTSPPYLNGTSYIRNTKLELWLLSFIASEKELSKINEVCMVCGINNVQKNRVPKYSFSEVEAVASRLDEVSPDKRIPAMVRGYFSDMKSILSNCSEYLTKEGRMVLDIGDSRFYGVNVETDNLLVDVAAQSGLTLLKRQTLARRLSKDKTPLKQVELTFGRS